MSEAFVVSDIHGHLEDLRRELRRVGLLGPDDRWTGGDSELFVLGDLMDRGPDGIGVLRLLRDLQAQAPGRVSVLLGNHEVLAIGAKLFPRSRFAEVWLANGGRFDDQELTPAELSWLRDLPAMALEHDRLMMHSDTTAYLGLGDSVEEINESVREALSSEDVAVHWQVLHDLSDRHAFTGADAAATVRGMLERLGGARVVHGHSIIGTLTGQRSEDVTEPWAYADGLAVAIDGGRYDGGPLLVVRLP